MIAPDNRPIAAIATAPGRGGIGVIRLSGQNLQPLIHSLYGKDQAIAPRRAHFMRFKSQSGEVIDEGLLLYFPGPHSYTGEDVIELQGHGGPAVLQTLLQRCLELGQEIGLRLAAPGEFTQRAFLNNKMDLAQAEAVADLINATSGAAARGAMASLSGAFSARIQALSEELIHLRMLVEATLDFPEEEIEFLKMYQVHDKLAQLHATLQHILDTSRNGRLLRDGIMVVLAGKPNVGKSSLLNALAGEEVAIVTPVAGTTRDRIIEQIHLEGVPLHIVDTAGLRETSDEVEKIGIERTLREISRADLLIHLQDCQDLDESALKTVQQHLPPNVPVINVFNKIDLLSPEARSKLASADLEQGRLHISVKQEENLDLLRQAILKTGGWNGHNETPWLARERHIQALEKAMHHLNIAAQHAALDDSVLDLFAEELRLSHVALGSIVGEFSSDDLLGEIFSSFCIGK